MTKFVTTLLFAVLAALGVYMARRRILFALKTGAIVYVVLMFARLLLDVGSMADHMDDLIWPAILLLIAWVILWWISTSYAERREREKRAQTIRRASSTGRSAR
jgi:membrane protein implicated in regulation of membrane protease activity